MKSKLLLEGAYTPNAEEKPDQLEETVVDFIKT